MKHEAFVYGYQNITNDMRYIGYRKSKELDDGYVFSSEDLELRKAWSLGHLRRSILARGSVADMITMERKLLKHADARRNDNWYNKTNGGGAEMYDPKLISDEQAKVGIDWINGIEPVVETKVSSLVDIDLVDKIWKDVQEGRYEVIEEPTELIQAFKHNQVRLVLIDNEHVKRISDHMIHDPVKARKNVSPIIVCVDKHGQKWIIDGNHTSKAIVKAKWTSAPVIYINKSVFLDRKTNINRFGQIANHNPKIKKPSSTQDCQRAIADLYKQELADKDEEFQLLQGEEFVEQCKIALYPMWTRPQIAGNIKPVIDRIKTNAAEATMNFKRYSHSELESEVAKFEKEHPDVAVITISSGSVYNAGIGGIMNKMGGMEVWDGMIITHHNGMNEYEKWSTSEDKLKKAMERLHPNANVQYKVLPPFIDNES